MSSRTTFLMAAGFLLIAAIFYLVNASSNLVFLNLVLAVFFTLSGLRAKRTEADPTNR